jgi:hypothetical protein
MFHSSWRVEIVPTSAAGIAEARVVAARRPTTENLESILSNFVWVALRDIECDVEEHSLLLEMQIQLRY